MPHVKTTDCTISNVTPVRLVVVGSRQPRRDGYYIRFGMHKSKRGASWRELLYAHVNGRFTAPGMTAKGVKWAMAQEETSL